MLFWLAKEYECRGCVVFGCIRSSMDVYESFFYVMNGNYLSQKSRRDVQRACSGFTMTWQIF